jgi:molybdopterin synthase sulfur carrier subunit
MPSIKLFAGLRKLAGKKEIIVPGASIQEVLENLAREYPQLQLFLVKDGQLHPRGILTMNGQAQDPETGLETPVSEQDQIAIFPPVGGG